MTERDAVTDCVGLNVAVRVAGNDSVIVRVDDAEPELDCVGVGGTDSVKDTVAVPLAELVAAESDSD